MFPTKVLLAVDGSRESHLACARTADLISHTSAELHVVHVGVVSPWTHSRTLSPDQIDRVRTEAGEAMAGDLETLRQSGLDPHEHVRVGRATDEVLRLRDEIDADLIVLGSRGRNTFKRVLLGNDAEGIVRHAPCPVLVVRSDR